MIFIGPQLSDPHAHFVTNIIECIGTGNDLVIDLDSTCDKEIIFNLITEHMLTHNEKFIIYNAYEDEDYFLSLPNKFPNLLLVIVFSDDEWRHSNYDRYLALYADVFTIAVLDNIKLYQSYGLEACYMQWACNPKTFHPLPGVERKYEVSFIGAAYGKRIDYMRFIVDQGIRVKLFGRGWENVSGLDKEWGGYLTHEKMLQVINQSKINLNFLWTSSDPDRSTIKGRTMELAACKSFQLSNNTDEFTNYGFVDGENIAVFNDENELLRKIRYYLTHEREREAIAARAYDHVLHNHTWNLRFQAIFARLNEVENVAPIRRSYRVFVITQESVTHKIAMNDRRLDLRFFCGDIPQGCLEGVDGVIRLANDSTINNDVLYMMAFGLAVDKSDMIAANFYVQARGKKWWIRFKDKIIERKRSLLEVLPRECLMFSMNYVKQHGCRDGENLRQLRISFIEYPAFYIALTSARARLLRLHFAYYRNARKQFKAYIRHWKLVSALSLAVDVLWQKYIVR